MPGNFGANDVPAVSAKDSTGNNKAPSNQASVTLDAALLAILNPIMDSEDAKRQALSLDASAPIDGKLLACLPERSARTSPAMEQRVLRVLDIIESLGPRPRTLLPLMKFLTHPNKKIESKAVKITSRLISNADWIDRHARALDPRVRSNLLEAIVANPAVRSEQKSYMLGRAARDPNHRVAVTALLLLAQGGHSGSRKQLEELHENGTDAFKKAAAWALRNLEPKPPAELSTTAAES